MKINIKFYKCRKCGNTGIFYERGEYTRMIICNEKTSEFYDYASPEYHEQHLSCGRCDSSDIEITVKQREL